MKNSFLKALVFVLWYLTHFVLGLNLVAYAFPELGENKILTYPSATEVYNLLRVRLQVSTPNNLSVLLLAAMFMLSAVVWGLSSIFTNILQRLSLSYLTTIINKSFYWGVGNYFLPSVATLNFVYVLTFIGIYFFGWIGLIFLLIFLLACPMTILNKQFLEADFPKQWYPMHWAGWQPATIFVIGFICIKLIDIFFVDFTEKTILGDFVVFTGWEVLKGFLVGVLLSVFIYKIKWREIVRELRVRANIKFIAMWLLLEVKFLILVLWVAPPFLLVASAVIYVVPTIRDTHVITGRPLGVLFSLFVSLADGFTQYWYFFIVPIGVFILMVCGRCLILFDRSVIKLSDSDTKSMADMIISGHSLHLPSERR